MDPSEENLDEDLFADLYGDEEPPKAKDAAAKQDSSNPPSAALTAPPANYPAQTSQASQEPQATVTAQKAVDPRAPPPAATATPPVAKQEPATDDPYGFQGVDDFKPWDAATAGHDTSMSDNKVYDAIGRTNGSGDAQGTGSPAIKEDGKMFIGGLNWETTDDSLKEYFSQFGEVTECTVMRDGPTGRSRGFGFLTFRDPKTVNIVMVKEHYLDGKIIDPKRAIPRDEQEKTSKIFVGGVSQDATESDFREFFTQFGRVLDATLMMDKDTGRPRGFGFVTFDSEAAVENALNCPELVIHGKPIEVKKAQPRGNIRERMNAHFDDRDDKPFNRGSGGSGSGGGGGSGGGRFDNNGSFNTGMQQGQINAQAGAYNGLSPQMMAQYWQNMQRYMQAMQQFGRGGGGPMPVMNPAMMQQAMQNMQSMTGGGGGMMAMNPQMQMQMMQMRQQQMQQPQMSGASASPPPQGPQGAYGGAATSASYGENVQQQGYDQSGAYGIQQQQQQQQQAAQNQFRQARGFQNHPSQRDYQPPQQHPSSWEGMYDDVPPQQVIQQVQQPPAQQQQARTGTPQGPNARFEGPPPNAPTGPKNQKPGSNYRGGGRGGAVAGGRGAGYGFHPYARNAGRF